MLPKDFENYELRLKKLQEEREANFLHAQKILESAYGRELSHIFPRDVLGMKKSISAFFIVDYAQKEISGEKEIDASEIFQNAVKKALQNIPLSSEKKEMLFQHLCKISEITKNEALYFKENDSLRKDPFFALVEDFSFDGNISKEEFLLLQQNFEKTGDFMQAVEELPSAMRQLFSRHILLAMNTDYASKKIAFEQEFSGELHSLKSRGYVTQEFIYFVSKAYYKTPEKYRSRETQKQRMRRTFKIALLRLLRLKYSEFDSENILKLFENCETFEDYFFLLSRFFDILAENPEAPEIYQSFDEEITLKSLVLTAEQTQEKILNGESIIARISKLFSKNESSQESALLAKTLDASTDLIGEELHFAHNENAGIFKQAEEKQRQEDEEENYENMSPETAYELLSYEFQKLQNEKQKCFLSGDYIEIDELNEKLLSLEIKLQKLTKILGLENDEN